ncbi:MAG: Gldg family protein [Myxococcota bacterium]
MKSFQSPGGNRLLYYLPGALFLTGLVALFIAERALSGLARWGVGGLGLLCIVAIGLGALRLKSADGDRRRAAGRILIEYAIVLVGLLLYFVQLDALGLIEAGKLQTVLQVSWPALVLLGIAPAIAMEVALAGMARTPTIELWRIRFAGRAARIVALAIVAFAGVNYASAKWNRKVDLSYFKTTEAGESTKKIVEGLTQPVRFILFFPPGNEVLERARSYFETLAVMSEYATVEIADQALDPDLARDLRIRANGYLAIKSDTQTETLRLGLKIESARGTLRQLDAKVQEKLLRVVRPARVAYFTTGHLERDYAPLSDDKRLGVRDFRTLLESLGLRIKRLGLGEGLGREIPDDATLVVVAGPLEPFLPGERAAIEAYAERGGRLFIFVDPDNGTTEPDLLALFGVTVTETLVANERYLFRLEGRGESPYNLVTTRSSAHPTMTTLSRSAGRLSVALMGTGAIKKVEQPPANMKITMTLRSMAQSWIDTNRNGKFDRKIEKKKALDFAAAIEREGEGEGIAPMRAVVVADADVAGNGLVRNQGNTYFLRDAARWLVGDEDTAGTVESEKDVPIVHRKDEDTIVFYGTSIIIPFVVLAGGLLISGASRRRKKDS